MKFQLSVKKVLHNGSILLSGSMTANICGFMCLTILTQSQGALLFGYYTLFLVFIEVIERIFSFQTWQAFIKFGADLQALNEDHCLAMLLKYCFLVDLISLSIATLIALSLSSYSIEFFDIPQHYSHLLLLMSLTILFRAVSISTGIFRLFDEFKVQAGITAGVAIFKLTAFCFLALMASDFEFFVYATILSQFLAMILNLYWAKKVLMIKEIQLSYIFYSKIDRLKIKKLRILPFIIYNNFDVSVRMVSRQLDMIILGRLYGPETVALFKIVKEVSNLMARLTDPLYQAIYPALAKLIARGDKSEAKDMARKISYCLGVAGLVFYIFFVLMGQFTIKTFFGDEFLDAYGVTLVYFFATYIAIITLPLYPMQHAFGFARDALINQIHTTLIYLPVLLILIVYYGIVGAAVAYIFYYLYLSRLTVKSLKRGFQQ
ncbi:oligosaccharide flippase family protein [Luminiphilus sp.]|nr:oligosaccharide flippase family protein [Luminiphilus sp.]